MQYYTTQYKSRAQHFMGEVAPLWIIATALFGVFYLTNRNRSDIIDLNYHHHERHGASPVNFDGDYLYLSGAWF